MGVDGVLVSGDSGDPAEEGEGNLGVEVAGEEGRDMGRGYGGD